ncbi:Golgi transport complex subunit 6 [Mortierella claussenii]|nr:Golgi transport complex subunit 6 [Mortierella claussenii]
MSAALILAAAVATPFIINSLLFRPRGPNRTTCIPYAKERVVIIGASSGIGSELARLYAHRRAHVVIVARRRELLDQLVVELRSIAGSVHALQGDVTAPQDVQRITTKSLEALGGGIDTLIICAGVISVLPFEELAGIDSTSSDTYVSGNDYSHLMPTNAQAALDASLKIMNINYHAPLNLTSHFLPALTRTSPAGNIMVVSSMAGKIGAPTRSIYCASKHAAQGFFDALSMEVERTGVHVGIVSPGTVATDLRHSAVDLPESGSSDRPSRQVAGTKKGAMTARACAEGIVRGSDLRQHNVVMPWFYQVSMALNLVSPGLYWTSLHASPTQLQTGQQQIMSANPLGAKLTKLLSSSLDDPKLRTSLTALSDFYSVNAVNARHNLRGDIERRGTLANYELLRELEKVNAQFLELEAEMNEMNSLCQEMQDRLNLANDKTVTLLEQTDALREQSKICQVRQTIMEAFLERFTLSESEITILCSTAMDVTPIFFDALEHLENIHADCNALLITEHQRAGLEIMDSMTTYRSISYDKLYRWMQTECRTMSRPDGMMEVREVTKKAIQALKQNDQYFRSVLEELVHVRRNTILRAFIDALTRGGPGGTPRPIELHAHDPLRYIGDMLAWIHQTVASEREFLESLLSSERRNKDRGQAEVKLPKASPLRLVESDMSDAEIVDSLLDKNLEGTARPLKSRVEQVLVSQANAITAFKISNLIKFYSSTIERAIGSEASLSKTLQEISLSSMQVFFEAIGKQSADLLRRPDTPGADLGPTPAVKETVLQLKEIMKSFDTSFVQADEGNQDFAPILSAMIDPLFQTCEIGAANQSAFNRAIFMMNCLHYVQSALVYPFTKHKVEDLEKQIQEYVDTVVIEQHTVLLKQSGIAPLMQALETKDDKTPLSMVPSMDAASITAVLSRLDYFLGAVNLDLTQWLSKIVSSRLAKSISTQNVKMFIDSYRRLCEAIEDPKNCYEFPATILTRTADEVEMLLVED